MGDSHTLRVICDLSDKDNGTGDTLNHLQEDVEASNSMTKGLFLLLCSWKQQRRNETEGY